MTTVTELETRRADELKPGDWLAFDENGDFRPCEVKAVFQYPTEHGPRVHLTTQAPGKPPYSSVGLLPDSLHDMALKSEIDMLSAGAKRAQQIADIRALATWLEERPWLPLPDLHSNQHVYGLDGYRQVLSLAERGATLDTHLDDRTVAKFNDGPLFYSVIAWHDGGRPAEPAPEPVADVVDGPCTDSDCPNASWPHRASSDLAAPAPEAVAADPTGLAYTRADDGADPQPAAGRVPAHLEDGVTGEVELIEVESSERVEVGADGCGCPITEELRPNDTSIDGTERVEHRPGCWNA